MTFHDRIESYRHFGRCLFLSNGTLELIIPLDFGIRILGLRPPGGENLFYEQPAADALFTTPGGWRLYGGHRFWLAPENERSYWPDNSPVEHELHDGGVVLRQPADGFLDVEKSLDINFGDDPEAVAVTHRAINRGGADLRCGLWGISTLRAGGTASVPFSGTGDEYSPTRSLSVWENYSLSDERLRFGDNVVYVDQLPVYAPFKIGLACREGEMRYDNGGYGFTIRFDVDPGRIYPDANSAAQIYTHRDMLEIESLSPLVSLAPGDSAEHKEYWTVTPNGE